MGVDAIPRITEQPLPVLVVGFAVAAGIVWWAGRRLAHDADDVAHRTGLGHAFLGLVILGTTTSLPEIATTITASVRGNPDLAVNNLLGGVTLQLTVLALADLVVSRRPLTERVVRPAVLLQGLLLVAALALAAGAIALDEPLVGGAVGPGPLVLIAFYAGSLVLLKKSDAAEAWTATPVPTPRDVEPDEGDEDRAHVPAWRLALRLLATASILFVAGAGLALTGEGIADATGLGSSFVGAVLVAFATSLPEISTTIAAVRLGNVEMAFGDIFGTNILEVGLLALADAAFVGPPVLDVVGAFSLVTALLGILITVIWLAGLLERPRAVARVGVDAALVVAAYALGLVILYTLR